MGSDDHGKQELASDVLARADIVAADSLSQCIDHGECYSAIKDNQIEENSIVELGDVINHPGKGRTHHDQITVADLTGVAVQNIQIAKLVIEAAQQKGGEQPANRTCSYDSAATLDSTLTVLHIHSVWPRITGANESDES